MLFGELKRIFRNAGYLALSAVLQTRAFITYKDDAAPFRKLDDLILAFEGGIKVLVAVKTAKKLNGQHLDLLLDLFLNSMNACADEKKSINKLCSEHRNAQFPASASLRYGYLDKGQFVQPKDLVSKQLESRCIDLNRRLYELIDNVVFPKEKLN